MWRGRHEIPAGAHSYPTPSPVSWTRGGLAMKVTEETIDATLGLNGQLRPPPPSQVPPGPVRVTIRVATPGAPRRGLADIIREIRADQVARGFHGLTAVELRQREAEVEAENDEYDREMERVGALPPPVSGAP